jgi:hypothetical protein
MDKKNSLENFSSVLEGVKLNQTALVFRTELEKKNNLHNLELTLSKNPLMTNLLKKVISKNQNLKTKNDSNSNNSKLKETKIYKFLYENFDNNPSTNPKIKDRKIENENVETPKVSYTETQLNDIDNLNISNKLNNTNKNETNEEDSIFANMNESQDSNVTAFIPPKKLNPKTKKTDERDKKPFGGTTQLDKMLKLNNIKINQSESSNIMDSSSFFQNSHFGNIGMDSKIMDLSQSEIDEYVDDDDPGFDLYECDRQYQNDTSKKLA